MLEKNDIRIPTVVNNQYLYEDFIMYDTAYDRVSDFWRSNRILSWCDEDSKHVNFSEVKYLTEADSDMFAHLGFAVNQMPWFHSFKVSYNCENGSSDTNIVTFLTLNRSGNPDWECYFNKSTLDYQNQIIMVNSSNFSRFIRIPNEPNSVYANGIKHMYRIPDSGDYLSRGLFVATGIRGNKETLFYMVADFCKNEFTPLKDVDGNIVTLLDHGDSIDSQAIAWSCILPIEGEYLRMWYETYDGVKYRICTAISYDGMKWYKEGIVLDGDNIFDSHGASRPFVKYDTVSEKYKMYYTAFDGDIYRICTALSLDGGTTFSKTNQVEYYDSSSNVFKNGIRSYSEDENKRYIKYEDTNQVFKPIIFFETVISGIRTTITRAPTARNTDYRSALQGFPYKTGILTKKDSITIYTMTAERPSMWMKFPIGANKIIRASQSYFTQFVNGNLFVLRITPSDPSIVVIEFANDVMYELNATQSKKFEKSIMNREQDGVFTDWDRVLLSGSYVHNIRAVSIGADTYLGVCTENGFDLIDITNNTKKTFLVSGSNFEPIWCDINKHGDAYIVIKDFSTQDTQIVAYYAIHQKNSETTFKEYADAIYTMTWGAHPVGIYDIINGVYGLNEIENVRVTNRGSNQDPNSNKIIIGTDTKGITVIEENQGNEANYSISIHDTIPTQSGHQLAGTSNHFISAQIFDNNLYAISDSTSLSDYVTKFNVGFDTLIESYGGLLGGADENTFYKYDFANNR